MSFDKQHPLHYEIGTDICVKIKNTTKKYGDWIEKSEEYNH